MISATPLAPGKSANFRNVELVQRGSAWTYQPTLLTEAIQKFVLGMGLLVAVIGLVYILSRPMMGVLLLIGGGVVFYAGKLVGKSYAHLPIFDIAEKMVEVSDAPMMKLSKDTFQPRSRRVPFSQIAALQIVAKWARVSGRPEKFEAFELNLVLADHSRFNLVDHRDRSPIEQDARLLAEVLNVPVVGSQSREHSMPSET